jgi:hypothetical protein
VIRRRKNVCKNVARPERNAHDVADAENDALRHAIAERAVEPCGLQVRKDVDSLVAQGSANPNDDDTSRPSSSLRSSPPYVRKGTRTSRAHSDVTAYGAP